MCLYIMAVLLSYNLSPVNTFCSDKIIIVFYIGHVVHWYRFIFHRAYCKFGNFREVLFSRKFRENKTVAK